MIYIHAYISVGNKSGIKELTNKGEGMITIVTDIFSRLNLQTGVETYFANIQKHSQDGRPTFEEARRDYTSLNKTKTRFNLISFC